MKQQTLAISKVVAVLDNLYWEKRGSEEEILIRKQTVTVVAIDLGISREFCHYYKEPTKK